MLSLTRKRNNLLMWSHYANAHQGFVIGFDTDNPFFKNDKTPRTITPLWEVNYSEKRPMVPEFEQCGGDLTQLVFLTKSNHWSYEEELRMFAQPKAAAKTVEVGYGPPIYLLEFPKQCVGEVIFGFQMKEQLTERISKIIQKHYPNAKLFQACLHETDFDLDIVAL